MRNPIQANGEIGPRPAESYETVIFRLGFTSRAGRAKPRNAGQPNFQIYRA
jgi:hypothetical protein